MADRLQVDLVLLESISSRLRRSGEMLGAARAGKPAMPDAGEATPIFAELLSRLSESSANLVAGLQEAGTRVAEANQTYAASDAAAGRHIDGAY
ncbi:hypothetical protein OHA21_51310 [Actinoplanes sp. NBC_00393]|uniref:hypothetical protein n=1 Tax=Actinoplanes sp. NBC_00393 TaxID=2975953 RepID=UPI002E1BA5F9